MLIVSPHMDDAVLSAGQLMAGRPDVVVCTVFAGRAPDPRQRTTYDANCGFDDAEHAIASRRQEDDAALRVLRARARHLAFVDHQYAPDTRPTPERIASEVAAVVDEVRPDSVLWPVGLGHPDHMLVAEAGRLFAGGVPRYVYEELPYRVLHPEQVPGALAAWGVPYLAGDFLGTGEASTKQRAMAQYRSQLWALDRNAWRCPERFHLVPACA
jgi:LmbE family N-acetylglucosaminyl deacetylase